MLSRPSIRKLRKRSVHLTQLKGADFRDTEILRHNVFAPKPWALEEVGQYEESQNGASSLPCTVEDKVIHAIDVGVELLCTRDCRLWLR